MAKIHSRKSRNEKYIRFYISSIKKGGLYKEACFLNCENAKEYDYNNRKAQHYDAYYALDGLFDFVKNGENRFGMSLGINAGVGIIVTKKNGEYIHPLDGGTSLGLTSHLRTFYTQISYSAFLAKSNPLISKTSPIATPIQIS